ncbi:unnamed protein product [Bursaphelenchus xylophilus]|uniref:(pine wood nematode) hypothetical protein n=1 Tax=Bursaphelenchus xylophilus TaxID=6326 RepID=A0A1I7SS20_BURXY|nr:unnamed protein product [Bursaphelenchus xylophilus]CAG9105783.1 unnamed protein product [Bursaphelenchus xylophilus]
MFHILHAVFLSFLPQAICFGFFQSVGAKGRVLCHGIAVDNEAVILVEKDWFFNDLLEQSATNDNGEFTIWGMDKEVSEIDPIIKIESECPVDSNCVRKFKMKIPKQFITWHRKPPGELFDMGEVELLDAPLKSTCNLTSNSN